MLLSFQRPWRLRAGGASSVVARSEPFPSGQWSLARSRSRVQAPNRACAPARRGTVAAVAISAGALANCELRPGGESGDLRPPRGRGAVVSRLIVDFVGIRPTKSTTALPAERRRARSTASPHPTAVRRALPRPYETTWTWISRRRGRSSKSISTSCCQVPSTSRPPTSGTVSDGPTSDARRCACALSSLLRTLWA
jgi:hypothetical protein